VACLLERKRENSLVAANSLPSNFPNLPHCHLFENFDPLIVIAVTWLDIRQNWPWDIVRTWSLLKNTKKICLSQKDIKNHG
jgi:hypothetical protein